jgi:hypothetical protein
MLIYYIIIWTVSFKLQNHFDKLALAHMDDEQREIKRESERDKSIVLSKMKIYYIKVVNKSLKGIKFINYYIVHGENFHFYQGF